MCFSAQASFVTAAITGGIGIVALTRINEPREGPFAAAPLLFALQQAVEGLLWLNLPSAPDGSFTTVLTFLYLLLAEAFWPFYAPFAIWLIEPSVNNWEFHGRLPRGRRGCRRLYCCAGCSAIRMSRPSKMATSST